MNQSEIKTCPMCSGTLKKEKIDYKAYADDQEFTIQNILGTQCADCGETYFDTKTAIKIEKTIESIQKS